MPADRTDLPASSPSPLDTERAHLAASRAALRTMRAEAEGLDISDVTANWVNAEVLASELALRIKSLADLADTPLFFGRVDYEHDLGEQGDETGRRFYIGRRHVHDAHGDPMVIDWRAPASQPFYRASKTDPQDVGLRRRFGYDGGELTAYEDEHLTDPEEAERSSALLQREIEKPRVGPMRDIVATIQPEQDEIVRAGLSGSVCVQGAPGTGKTAVGLHRVAYLLYAIWCRPVWRSAARTPRPRPGSRATRGWRRCCAGRYGTGCGRCRPRAWSWCAARAAGGCRPRRSRRS